MSQVIKEYFKPPAYGRGTAVPPAPIPPKLKLHDGREFDVADLFRACGKSTNIKLNTPLARTISGYQRVQQKSKTRVRSESPNRKYEPEERQWHTKASDVELMVKYGITKKEASRLRAQSTYIVRNSPNYKNINPDS